MRPGKPRATSAEHLSKRLGQTFLCMLLLNNMGSTQERPFQSFDSANYFDHWFFDDLEHYLHLPLELPSPSLHISPFVEPGPTQLAVHSSDDNELPQRARVPADPSPPEPFGYPVAEEHSRPNSNMEDFRSPPINSFQPTNIQFDPNPSLGPQLPVLDVDHFAQFPRFPQQPVRNVFPSQTLGFFVEEQQNNSGRKQNFQCLCQNLFDRSPEEISSIQPTLDDVLSSSRKRQLEEETRWIFLFNLDAFEGKHEDLPSLNEQLFSRFVKKMDGNTSRLCVQESEASTFFMVYLGKIQSARRQQKGEVAHIKKHTGNSQPKHKIRRRPLYEVLNDFQVYQDSWVHFYASRLKFQLGDFLEELQMIYPKEFHWQRKRYYVKLIRLLVPVYLYHVDTINSIIPNSEFEDSFEIELQRKTAWESFVQLAKKSCLSLAGKPVEFSDPLENSASVQVCKGLNFTRDPLYCVGATLWRFLQFWILKSRSFLYFSVRKYGSDEITVSFKKCFNYIFESSMNKITRRLKEANNNKKNI